MISLIGKADYLDHSLKMRAFAQKHIVFNFLRQGLNYAFVVILKAYLAGINYVVILMWNTCLTVPNFNEI